MGSLTQGLLYSNYKRGKGDRPKKGEFQGSEQHTGIKPSEGGSNKTQPKGPRKRGRDRLSEVRSPLGGRR